MTSRPDAVGRRMSSPQSPNQGDTTTASNSVRQPSNATVYQTTGPGAHTGPITSQDSGEPILNPRSCVTCRRRKVRCDKQMPCSNCRRALIPCIFPAPGRAPRQNRPKDPNAPTKSSSQREVELINRLRKLEGIVEELSGQIDDDAIDTSGLLHSPRTTQSDPDHFAQHRSLNDINDRTHTPGSKSGNEAPEDSWDPKKVGGKLGRMVLHDQKGTARYVSSGFWSKMNDEINAIRAESHKLTDEEDDDSDWEESQTGTPGTGLGPLTDHHGFILGYRSTDVDLSTCYPVPLHSTYLWSVYQENVEPLLKLVHVPSMELILRDARKSTERLTPGNEALVFAIYFSAMTALEPEEVQANFGVPKDELMGQYRFALEQALSKANFLNTSEFAVIQAFTLFLIVVRRHDDSRFCWSLTSLAVRLAQGMGLHRDGSNFGLSPFDTEMRRRVWWGLMTLDLRSAEEHGTDMAIIDRSFDTEVPLNINDADISPESKVMPQAREGRTDSAVALVRYEICSMARKIHISSSALGVMGCKTDLETMAAKEKTLVEIYEKVEHKFLRHVMDETDPLYWVAAMIARVIMAKTCLVIYHPMLFPGAEQKLTTEIRQRLFVAAIEIMECNYKLGTDPRCKQYRWLFKTYTTWHAIAYTLIEICRRPWTALVERGWQAAEEFAENAPHLNAKVEQAAVFLPLRKLALRAKKHREAEILRLKADQEEARRLDFAERMNPAQARFGPVPGTEHKMDQVREQWRLMIKPESSEPSPFFKPSSDQQQDPVLESFSQAASLAYQQNPLQQAGAESPAMNMDNAMEFVGEIMARPNVAMNDFWNMASTRGVDGKSALCNDMGQMQSNQDGDLHQQVLDMGLQPSKDGQMTDPYIWDDGFANLNTKLDDDLMIEDPDVMGEGFNWQDWSQSIRGLEMQSAQLPSGPAPPMYNQDQQW